mmetsp:Transcript_19254/g.53706  ORF Transcript_19254/g.53706 Transcript_19254/m.53706 type:complete len:402 (+) Transcript_19254:204-1409(+)
MDHQVVVLDCGTGFTKLGFSGNVEPSDVFPTVMAYDESNALMKTSSKQRPLDDLDFVIGHQALRNPTKTSTVAPLKHGMVADWDNMERFWQQCIFRKLRCNPENHRFLLTEPPMNTPENRERTAEVMFETFGVPGLYIGVQAVLALAGSFASQGMTGQRLTGTVVDSGDGVTHVVPVVDGYVASSCVRSMPIAGASVTAQVQKLLRERGEPIPPELSMEAAKQVKEQHCYVCSDVDKELRKAEQDPGKYNRQHTMVNPKTGKEFTFSVQSERFLGLEVFFSQEDRQPMLPQVVDSAIQACSIDTRRPLYSNIVLSGGSTMFKDFGRRMQRDVKQLLYSRTSLAAQEVNVNVVSHYNQRYAVWFGGSVLASTPAFAGMCNTKADYEEYGPSICRSNIVFKDI